MSQFIRESKLKYRVDLIKGIAAAPAGLKNLLLGKNDGKVIVQV
jgi:NADPH-dependent curcumin reductase CurA